MRRFLALFLCVMLIFISSGCNKHVNKTNKFRESPNEKISKTGLTWPEGQALPTTAELSKTIDRVYVNQSKLSNDQFTTLTALQGLVNREQPRILLQKDDDIERWAAEKGAYEYIDYKGADTVWTLFVKYKNYFKGYVIFDTSRGASSTINLANTVAGLKDCLPVSEVTMNKLKELGINYDVVEDFRGKFSNNIEVYNYLYDNYWKDCSKRLLVSASPGSHPGFVRDIAVAAKSAVIWLDPRVKEEADIIKKFLQDLSAGKSIIMGWWPDEGAGIKIGTNYGIPTVPSDYYENYTIHAGMDRNLDPPVVPDKPKLENKIYVAATMTDGDNLQFNQHVMKSKWDNKQRGKVTLNWTISPALADAGPDLLNYFYRTATPNDCLVSGPSGIGYASVENMPGNLIDTYAQWSDQYFSRTDIKFVTIWFHMLNGNGYDRYTKNAHSLYGLSVQTWYDKTIYTIYNNKPVFPQVPWYSSGWKDMYNNIYNRAKGFDGTKPMFFASHAVSWDVGVPEMILLEKELKKALGEDNVVFVRLDHMSMLINEYENKPYNLCLNSDTKITSSDDTVNAKLAADGTYNTQWSSSKDGEKWLQFDLGANYNISRYIMKNAGMDLADKELNTHDYEVLVSTDGSEWKRVDLVRGNTDNSRDIDIDPVKARYVKFVITNPGKDGTARIADVEIYGTK